MIVSPKYIEIPSARDSVSSVCFICVFHGYFSDISDGVYIGEYDARDRRIFLLR